MSLVVQASGQPSAPAIVFLHGLGVSSWMWTEQVAALSQEYHCLAVDLPGNGESYQTPWRSLADSAAQVAGVIRERAAGGKAHVVGLSLGGYVALTLLAEHPDMVETTLVSGVTLGGLKPRWLYKGMMSVMAPLMAWDPLIRMSIRQMNLPEDAAALFARDSKRLRPHMTRRVFDEIVDYALPRALTGRPQRLLAVAGSAEAKAIRAGLGDFPRLIPAAAAALAPDAHHAWNGEHPQLFTAMIQAWVQGQPLPTPLQPVAA